MVTAIERHSGFGRVVTGSLRPNKPQQTKALVLCALQVAVGLNLGQ